MSDFSPQNEIFVGLNNGTDEYAEIKMTYLRLPELNPNTYDKSKATKIINALWPCINRTFVKVWEVIDGKKSEF